LQRLAQRIGIGSARRIGVAKNLDAQQPDDTRDAVALQLQVGRVLVAGLNQVGFDPED
jgi:hypothetical protein